MPFRKKSQEKRARREKRGTSLSVPSPNMAEGRGNPRNICRHGKRQKPLYSVLESCALKKTATDRLFCYRSQPIIRTAARLDALLCVPAFRQVCPKYTVFLLSRIISHRLFLCKRFFHTYFDTFHAKMTTKLTATDGMPPAAVRNQRICPLPRMTYL